MIEQMAIVIAFPGFSDLGRTVTPIFLYQFSAFSEKNDENLSTSSLNFLQNARSNSVLFSSSSVPQFQMPFEGLSFVKRLVKFGIIYATGPLLQN